MKKLKERIERHSFTINLVFGFFGLLGTFFGIYTYYSPLQQKPNLAFHINDVFSAVSLNKSLDGLSINYKGSDLQKNKLTLTVCKIKVVNDGKGDITSNLYADSPFGIGLVKGTGVIIGVKTYGDTSGYFAQNIHPTMKDSLSILFNKVIIESKKQVELEIVIIHKDGVQPRLFAMGKIAGMDSIPIITDDGEGFGFKDFIQAVLIPLVFFSFLYVIYLIKLLIIKMMSYVRWKRILSFFDYRLKPISDEKLLLANMYKKLGRKDFVKILKILFDKEERQKRYSAHVLEQEMQLKIDELRNVKRVDNYNDSIYKSDFISTIETLIKKGSAEYKDNVLVLNKSFTEEVERALIWLNKGTK